MTPAPIEAGESAEHAALRAKVGLYFDGELPTADEAAVLDHLAECAICQGELGDAVGIHVGAATPPPAKVIAIRRQRYAAVAVAAIAAAVLAVLLWPRGDRPVQLALAPARAVEVRFEAGPFAAYRPYAVVRGAPIREQISLEALAALARRGDTAVLAAALASSGDVTRAREQRAGSRSDAAAVAILAGDAEQAIAIVEAGPVTPAGAWNLGLAARALGLPALARRHFAEVVRANEPGWREEAAAQVAALDGVAQLVAADRAFDVRARAMIAGTGPAITRADAAQFPARARVALLDAARVADRAGLDQLAPIAEALDHASDTPHARAALARARAGKPEVRARFADRYRALLAQQLAPADVAKLVAELRRAGRDVDDVRLGALIWWPQLAEPGELARLAADTHDPWFELYAQRIALAGGAEAAGRLTQATDACSDAWAYRCAELASDAAYALQEAGRDDQALRYAERARAWYAAAVVPDREAQALAYLGELARYRDRRVLARAIFEEVELRAGDDCRIATYARTGRAQLELLEGRLAEARALLPLPAACGGPPDAIALTIAVDVARESGGAGDRDVAARWLAAARAAHDPSLAALADVGEGRLAGGPALQAWLAAHPPGDADRLAQRAWATDAVIAQAGERGDWAAAADAARAEIAVPALDGCQVLASVDQDRQVAAVRDRTGRWHGVARRAPARALDPKTFVPAELRAQLAGCPHVAVLARPPLHGNTQLLPPALPWAFVAGPPHAAPARAPRTVIFTDAAPPDPALQQVPLAPGTALPPDATIIRGAAATPARALAELADATYVEINAHGVADAASSDASFLALSPEPSGRFMLTAGDVRAAKISGAVVVLAACRSAALAPYLHRRWTLPDAFLTAGARAVIATDIDVPDAAAGAVFAELRRRITGGEAPAAALAAVRARDPGGWVARIAVFE